MQFTNVLIALVLFALTVVIRGSLLMLRGAVMRVLPHPYIRPIHAGLDVYAVFYNTVSEAFRVLDHALSVVSGAATLLLTVCLFLALAWTAVFIVYILGDLSIAILHWLMDIGTIATVYVRIVLWMLVCLMKALAWLFSQLLAVA